MSKYKKKSLVHAPRVTYKYYLYLKSEIRVATYLKYIILFSFEFTCCKSEEHKFFMRYEHADPVGLGKDITHQIEELEGTTDPYIIFVKSIDLSEKLTIAGREDEAIKLLQPYIKNVGFKAEKEDVAWLYLNYATANQYDRKQEIAEQYFKMGLSFAQEKNIEDVEHYMLHHYGRFLVEQKKYALAKECFYKALLIRQRLNDKRAANTQKALDTLDLIEKQETKATVKP